MMDSKDLQDALQDPEMRKKLEEFIDRQKPDAFGIEAEGGNCLVYAEPTSDKDLARVFYEGEWSTYKIVRESKSGYIVNMGVPVYAAKTGTSPSNISMEELKKLGLSNGSKESNTGD